MNALNRTRERLARILSRGELLLASLRQSECDEATLLAWRLNAVTVVAHIVSDKHHYRRELGRIAAERLAAPARSLELTLGVLRGLRDDLESGALSDVRGQLRGELMIDLLDRAEDHYERGYIEAAAILLVTILDAQLRALSQLNDISTARALDVMSAQLCKAGVYDAAMHHNVQRWSDYGQRLIQRACEAQRAEVAELLDGVARFLDEHPAIAKTLPREWQAAVIGDAREDQA